MDHFNYQGGNLCAENVPLADIGNNVDTPCYIYSRATLERHWHAFNDAFDDYPHQICYAVKANGNLAVLNLLARLGSGFDIVSGGELMRVIVAGGDPEKTIFSGMGKQDWEIQLALEKGIGSFNIESEGELERINHIALEMGTVAKISVRLNPDVDAKTHPYISTGLRDNKFGLAPERAKKVYKLAAELTGIQITGIACHIGSQLTELEPYEDALNRVLSFVSELEAINIHLDHIDFGGGLGVRYKDENPPSPKEYWAIIKQQMDRHGRRIPVTIEPGRAIVGNAGVLLTKVINLKEGDVSRFCIVDAAMNDLIRPALYQSYQEIVEVKQKQELETDQYDVVGPICESSDFLGKNRSLKVETGDYLAVRTSGAYAAVMSSNYNARQRPAEVMVDDHDYYIVKTREPMEALFAGETVLPIN